MSTTTKQNTLQTVQKLIEQHPDWKKGVIKRHLKFMEVYIESNFNIRQVADHFFFTTDDMISIFSRIERQLHDYVATKPKLAKQEKKLQEHKRLEELNILQSLEQERKRREEELRLEMERFKKEQERLKREEEERKRREEELRLERERKETERKRMEEERKAKELQIMLANLDNSTQTVFKTVLEKSHHIDVYQVYPKRLAEIIESLLETRNILKSAENLGIRKDYLVARVKGRNKARKPCEEGAIYYLKQAEEIA